MIKLPKKIRCLGSKTPDIKTHNLVHVDILSVNYVCNLAECSVLYYDCLQKIWYYKPGLKAKALQTSKD